MRILGFLPAKKTMFSGKGFSISYGILTKLTFAYILFPLLLKDRGLDIGIGPLGLSLHEAFKLFSSIPMSIFADRFGSLKVLIFGRVLFLIGLIFWSFCFSNLTYLLGFCFIGLSSGSASGSFEPALFEACKKSKHDFVRSISFSFLFGNICSIIIGLMFGYIFKEVLYSLIFSIIVNVIGIAYLAIMLFVEGDFVCYKNKNIKSLAKHYMEFIKPKIIITSFIVSFLMSLYISINDMHKLFMLSLDFHPKTIGLIYSIIHIGAVAVIGLRLFSKSPVFSFDFTIILTIIFLVLGSIGFWFNSAISSIIAILFLTTHYLREASLKAYIVKLCNKNFTALIFGLIGSVRGLVNMMLFYITYVFCNGFEINTLLMLLCGGSAALLSVLFLLQKKVRSV